MNHLLNLHFPPYRLVFYFVFYGEGLPFEWLGFAAELTPDIFPFWSHRGVYSVHLADLVLAIV
jgi:hypothetical protein